MSQEQQTSGVEQSTESAPAVESDGVSKDYPLSAAGTLDQPAQKVVEEKTVAEKIEQLADNSAEKPAVEEPPYTPNFKFKASDKEYEFDPLVQKFVKTPDVEKHLRELYEKSYGLDTVKGRFQDLKTRYEEASTTNQQLLGGLQDLRESYQSGDFDSFFKKLNIPQEKVLQWVLDKAHYNQLPPEQKAILDSRKSAEERARMLEKQNETLQTTHMEQLTQAREYALSVGLERPDVKQFAEAYEAARGPGKFKELVISQGQLAYYTKGVDISPEEAIKAAMDLVGVQQMQQQQAAKPVPQYIPPVRDEPKTVKTLPKVEGKSSASPVSRKFKSLAELKQYSKELAGS